MNYPRYEYSTEDELSIFEFESVGSKGKVKKVVQYTEMTIKGYFNLGFGDLDIKTREVNDEIVTNNGDGQKVLATVVSTVYAFTGKYPNAYVYLRYDIVEGCWIGASPELLLKENNQLIQTVSLAGTKAKEDEWTEKEYHEQQVVTDYIKSTLKNYTTYVDVDGPFSVNAGFFEHLKSFISAQIKDKSLLTDLLKDLHPTPAVGGMPKDLAKDFIIKNEGYNRSFYAGFMGYTKEMEAEYFVNLRCAKIYSNKVKLYVGGGIMPDSVPEKEWRETEMKSKTIGELLIDK